MYFIYKITNNESNKIYIGSTSNVDKRFKQHLYRLNKNNHHSQYFQNFHNKHKKTVSYKIHILDCFESEDDCREVEELLLNSNLSNLLNVSKKAGGGDLISKHPDNKRIRETTRQNSLKLYKFNHNFINYPRNGSENPNYKHGLYINRDVFCNQCGKALKTVTASKCLSCIAKNRVGSKNPFYSKSHSEATKDKLRKINTGKVNKSCHKAISIDNIVYPSVTEASKRLGIPMPTLSYRARSKTFSEVFYIN